MNAMTTKLAGLLVLAVTVGTLLGAPKTAKADDVTVIVKAPDGVKVTVKVTVTERSKDGAPVIPFNLYTVKATSWGKTTCGKQKFTDSEGRLWILVSGPEITRRQYVTGLYERGVDSGLPYLRVGGSLFKDPPSE